MPRTPGSFSKHDAGAAATGRRRKQGSVSESSRELGNVLLAAQHRDRRTDGRRVCPNTEIAVEVRVRIKATLT